MAGASSILLDRPGHEDFSEDIYRTLTVVDCAVMVIDAAKGIEGRMRKLFEICRLWDIPIVTFINKMDREAQDCFGLLDEISASLALDTAPATWPIGRAAQFVGTYDLRTRAKHFISAPLPDDDPRMVQLAEEAFAGDVVGIPNHGALRIGDTLTEGKDLRFTGVPYFAPEILRRVRLDDAMKAKKLRQALIELAEEGVVQLFRPQDGLAPIVGVVGVLQLDVLQSRLKAEYGVAIGFESTPFTMARWITGQDKAIEAFSQAQRSAMADDIDGDPVFLASSAFMLRRTVDITPDLTFHDIKQIGTQKI